MTLQLPSEIVVDRFLPTARRMLAVELADRGMAQQAIAAKLGVSQAAVSKYLSGDRTGEPRFAEDPRMVETVEYIAEGFAAGTLDDYAALAELLELIRTFEDRGPICAIHEEEVPALEGVGCDLCVRGRDQRHEAERDVLRTVRRAVRQFSNTPAVVDHVPNVGSNIGMALPDADAASEVAAVPGRLHAMGSQVNVPADPEFGASQHVARTILAAMTVDPEIRGAVNLRTTDALLDGAAERGLDTLSFDASYENRTERIRSLLAERGDVPAVCYHEGAFGIEPIAYVLGTSAVEAVDTAVACLEAA
ncbi:thiamine-phosphate synthase family protein [Halohasta salina]|uniref:thiamine-phosphate synthase family protein n=1 Tax=Halohasta salina TaxID=2961621 RepID=UPI0020A29905|nr:thiamine-phosphate synthase family protein [Halohasta salina]